MIAERYFEDYSVGEEIRAGGITLTEASIIDFAQQYDPQPFHTDKAAAEASPYGGLIASGWQVGLLSFSMLLKAGLLGRGSVGAPGMDEMRWHLPSRPGDTLYPVVEIVETRASQSKPDRGIVTMAYRVENQRGETVMSWSAPQMVLKRPR